EPLIERKHDEVTIFFAKYSGICAVYRNDERFFFFGHFVGFLLLLSFFLFHSFQESRSRLWMQRCLDFTLCRKRATGVERIITFRKDGNTVLSDSSLLFCVFVCVCVWARVCISLRCACPNAAAKIKCGLGRVPFLLTLSAIKNIV